MKRLVMILTLFLIAAPLYPADTKGQENVPVFTNEDIEKYKDPSERRKSFDEVRMPKNSPDFTGNNKGPEREGVEKLRRYEVPYKAYEGTARRIIISVAFNDAVTAPMVLDTGATGMHISVNLAEKLGIFERDEGKLVESTSGIGGSIPAVFTVIDKIQVGELEEHFVPTKVSRPFSEEFEGLVGMDFMANFSIQIDTRKHVIVFEEHPPDQRMPGGHDEEWWRTNFRQFAAKREEWAKLKRDLSDSRDSAKTATTVKTGRRARAVTVGELRELAERQYNEADKLVRRLEGYASEYAVPMEWREY
jgi:hypothetical protein